MPCVQRRPSVVAGHRHQPELQRRRSLARPRLDAALRSGVDAPHGARPTPAGPAVPDLRRPFCHPPAVQRGLG